MKLRVLAAAAVAAWSKTAAATTATVLPGVLDQPAGASAITATSQATSCPNGPVWSGPFHGPPTTNTVTFSVAVSFKSGGMLDDCRPGTASVQTSVDQTNWKTLDTQHTTQSPRVELAAPCQTGTWWYRGSYVTDDQSFKGNSNPVALSC